MTDSLNLDRLDAMLIHELTKDARQGVVELAGALGVTRNTVQARLKRLQEQGYLTGFVPRVDLVRLGFAVEAFAALVLEQGALDGVVAELALIPHVLEVHATTGQADLLVRVAATTNAELLHLIQGLVSIEGVSQSNTSVALATPLTYRVDRLLVVATSGSGRGRARSAVVDGD